MTELFSFMSHQVTLLQTEVYETNDHNVLCSLTQIDRCSHEGLRETVGAYSCCRRCHCANSDNKQRKARWSVTLCVAFDSGHFRLQSTQ